MGKISQVLTGFFVLSLPSTPACFTSISLRYMSVSGFALYSHIETAQTKVFDLALGCFYMGMHASFFHVCEFCIVGEPY